MKSLKLILKSLHESQYLTAHYLENSLINKQTCINTILLKNGQKLRQQLLLQWLNTEIGWAQSRILKTNQNIVENQGRLSFLRCTEFHNSYKQLCQSLEGNLNPVVLKTIKKSTLNPHERTLFKWNTLDDKVTLLVSDYFVPTSTGLEKFYNMQRERKIWWMRYSANPSRYFVEPYDLVAEHYTDDGFDNKCQSITIKSNFPYDVIDMESITLVPLNELQICNGSNKKATSQMSVIRSVINLDSTTCAIILDGSEHNRENALMLNRKLAPYQVVLGCQHTGDTNLDIMDDLRLHIEYVLCRAGLRLYDKPICYNSQIQSQNELITADSFGIPYAILLDENSIKTGIMKLRSRDTTLSETIHISDIPKYLLNIFTH